MRNISSSDKERLKGDAYNILFSKILSAKYLQEKEKQAKKGKDKRENVFFLKKKLI